MNIELRPITEPTGDQYERLLNDPRVTKHMPLHSGYMTATDCDDWADAKFRQWETKSDLGPWAVYIDGSFAGWGGLQPEGNGEAGIALVLAPDFWGNGLEILRLAIAKFRANGGTNPIVAQLAQSRSAARAMTRLGLEAQGQVVEGGQIFDRFVLSAN